MTIATTADPPGSIRSRRRRLKIGSSTGPDGPREDRARVHRGGVGRPSARGPGTAPGRSRTGPRRPPSPPRVERSTAETCTAQSGCSVGRPHPAPAEDRPGPGQPLGLEEELGEGRVAEVGAARGQDDLGVAGQLQLAGRGVVVDQRDPADLGAVLGRDDHLEHGLDRPRRGGGRSPCRRRRSPRTTRATGRPAGSRPTRPRPAPRSRM